MRELVDGFVRSIDSWSDAVLSLGLISFGFFCMVLGLFAPRAIRLIVAVEEWFRSFLRYLDGWPDSLLTGALIGSGCGIIVIALVAPRWLKIVVAGWVWFP